MAPTTTKKRGLEEARGNPKVKKTKVEDKSSKTKSGAEKATQPVSSLIQDEVDFPRGGGTTFTPLEVKAIRAEAAKEADQELFGSKKQKKKERRKSEASPKEKKNEKDEKREIMRVEHLNYKRINVGMKILAQVVSVEPLALILSLPNQLLAHVPITNISSQLTKLLESMEEDEDMSSSDDSEEEGDTSDSKSRIPDLFEIFSPGQYVRAVVSAVHAQGSTDVLGVSRMRDEALKASKRVELSLIPEKVNEGVSKSDLKSGFTLSAAIQSIEDHGYILDLGIPDVSGFLSFKDAEKGPFDHSKKLHVGRVIDCYVSKLSGNGRTCNVSANWGLIRSAAVSEVSSVTSVLPGILVHGLITAVLPHGINLQVLGFFGGTIDQFHLLPGSVEENYKVGQKVKARVLYDISPSTPPRFALSLADHIVSLTGKGVRASEDESAGDETLLSDAFLVGSMLESVKVIRVETDRGLIVEVVPGVEGFVHISQTSDDHVPTLPQHSGPWKVGTIHRARVTGYYPFDGLLQLSMRPSVLEQRFLQVGEVQPGEVIKGTVKKLTDSALFMSISGNVDGVIWPNHYADIRLKHPQKRFKPGGSMKCRILVVDAERKRVVLTAKKTLIESKLPVVAKLEDAKVGVITHAVVFKTSEKSLQVEFYNNLKAIVPGKEASETTVGSLSDTFPIGKVVQVRIISIESETGRIVASIRQASPNFKSAIMDISEVEIGNTVAGAVSEIQKDKAVITLYPTQIPALLSLNNLANRRGITVANLRTSLKVGDKIGDLVVTSRNPEKGFVLVATKPKDKEPLLQKNALSLDTVQAGQLVGGRVLRHTRHGALVKLTSHISGLLHPTDVSDEYDSGEPFPAADSVIKATVILVDKEKKQLILSTRPSRMRPLEQRPVVDKEIHDLSDLKSGETVRGFIKSVAEHGLFVTLGRGVDARVQIKELFDEFVKDWKSKFAANQLVKGRILSVDLDKKQVEMTFRTTDASRDNKPTLKLTDLSKGQKVEGVIKKIEDYGIFIEIEGSKLRGLCHKTELSDNKEADVTMALQSFREGDRVKTVVLSVDLKKRRISLGLKPSYFDDADFQSDDEDDENDANILGVVEEGEEIENDDVEEQEGDSEGEDVADDGSDEDGMDIDIATSGGIFNEASTKGQTAAGRSVPALKLDGGFQWTAPEGSGDVDMASSENDEEEGQSGKRKKKRKQIEQDLTADLHTKAPESNADFERLLLGSPNSSYLWVQYMSFQLQLSEIEKAKEIARRALRTISFREEQEKLNVWIALLNLENVYGTDESLETTFKEAARANDSKTIHLRLAAIFDQSEKPEKAEEQFKRTSKKFGQSSKVWTLFAEYYLKQGKLEEARSLLPRSLQSLEKRKHLKTISKFAQLEYKLGDPERGKTIFEGIVDSHPKRWDLWSIYLDMEAGQGDIASLRNLFDRIFTQKMTSHKAKAFFKKWLELERRLGDEEGADTVKAKAVEWTQRAAGSS